MIKFRYGQRPFGTPMESMKIYFLILELQSTTGNMNFTSTVPVVNTQIVKPSKNSFLKSLARKPLSIREMTLVDV